MRRKSGLLIVVGLFGLVASLVAAATRPATDPAPPEPAVAPVAVQRVSMPAPGLRDEPAAMVLVGSALIGLAAAVRRAA